MILEAPSSLQNSSVIVQNTENKEESNDKWLLCCLLLILLFLLLIGFAFHRLVLSDDDQKPTGDLEQEDQYTNKNDMPPNLPTSSILTKTNAPTSTATTSTATTTTTTTQPWKSTEFFCKYDEQNKEYFKAAHRRNNWPGPMCQTLVFIRTSLYDSNFDEHIKEFQPFIDSLSSDQRGFMLAAHFNGNMEAKNALDLPQKVVTLVQKHKFNRGGVMYVYNRTVETNISEIYVAFAVYLNQSNIRSVLIVDMYSNWEKDFNMTQLADNKYLAFFRSPDIIQRLLSAKVECQLIDNDPTGPKTFSEEMSRFQSAFKGTYNQYRMQIGLYAFKEGQEGQDLPRNQFIDGIIHFGLLYGRCTGLSLFQNDTDCTAKYFFENYNEEENFKTWEANYIFALHEEDFDRTAEKAQCSTNAYIFMMQHLPKED